MTLRKGKLTRQSGKPPTTKRKLLKIALLALLVLFLAGCADMAGTNPSNAPFNGIFGDRTETVDIILALTVVSVLPSILIMLTGFTRIIIVLSFVKNAIGTQQMPPSQVMVGLALFLTFFVMSPIFDQIKTTAYEPYIAEEITIEDAVDRAMIPLREFMLKQMKDPKDLEVFVSMSGQPTPVPLEEIKTEVIIPAFITSEIKRAFMMGFFIYLPFIVIDMIVASTLMAMGMMMLPPVVISMPFKVLIFVVVDGWLMIVETLVMSFQGG